MVYDVKNFIKDAIKTESNNCPLSNVYGANNDRLLHAAMGLSTEANEFLDPIKKYLFYGKSLDITNLKEELGDMLWYMAIAMDALDTNFEIEMARVIFKLKTRYPDKFDSDKAINRDLDAERKALEE